LQGIRVIEMGQLIAIPWAMKMLADMGAEVIRLESCHRQDNYRSDAFYQNDISGEFWNRGANFYEQNRNKLGLTLDLTQAEGLSILKELIAVSDIFAENFTPRVIKNFGLEYDALRQINPEIIMISSTGYGYTGPWAGFGATGPSTEAASGLAHMTGYVGGPPVRAEIPHTDFTAAEHTVFAVMAALVHRLRTGQGQFLDISHTQIASSTLPEALMDFAVNGHTEPRVGNGHPAMAPHGCYPCRGEDRWIVIAVGDDGQWHSLCQALGKPEWEQDSRFKEGLARWRHSDELDQLVGEATKERDAHQLMQTLQAAGVPAGAVLDSHDLLFDPHLLERGFFEVVSHHPGTGIPPLPYAGRPWKLLGTPAVKGIAAPTMGEDNKWVLSGLLGRTEEELSALEAQGVIGYAPTNPRPVQRPPMDEQVRQGRLLRYDADFREQVETAYPHPQRPS
jgi:benzylsuccinate CoA-transferase BbsF subunit